MRRASKRWIPGILALVMCAALLAAAFTWASAAPETSESVMIKFPRDGDINQVYGEDTWGHKALTLMNGWYTDSNDGWPVQSQGSFDGQVCYCIEPGVERGLGSIYTAYGEDFWDDCPEIHNSTISPETVICTIRIKAARIIRRCLFLLI